MGEHKLPRLNGAEPNPADVSGMFYLVDKVSGEKRLIREMTDVELQSYRAGVAGVTDGKMNIALTQLMRAIPNRLDAHLCLKAFEDAMQNAPLLAVIEYEQNRRANLAAPPPVDQNKTDAP